jgi:hypothetical protein
MNIAHDGRDWDKFIPNIEIMKFCSKHICKNTQHLHYLIIVL